MKNHPDKRLPQWEITPDEWPHGWKTTLIRDHPNDRPPWWMTTRMKNYPDKRPPWKNYPDKRPPWRETILMKDHSSWWKTILITQTRMKNYPDKIKRPPWRETILMEDHSDRTENHLDKTERTPWWNWKNIHLLRPFFFFLNLVTWKPLTKGKGHPCLKNATFPWVLGQS